MSDDPRPIATTRTLDGVQAAVGARRKELHMTLPELDAKAGLADGHSSKLLAPKPRKRLGRKSLERLLAATGLVLIVAVDNETPAAPKASKRTA